MHHTTVEKERQRMLDAVKPPRRLTDHEREVSAYYADAPASPPCEHKWVRNLGQEREYCIRCLIGRVEVER